MAGDPRPALFGGVDTTVSIRARHRWRAIRRQEMRHLKGKLFQSAPAIDGGRSGDTVYVPLGFL